MSAPRTMESFSKQDLIEFIKKSVAFNSRGEERVSRELSWVEYKRKSTELGAKMDALHADMAECHLPQDWGKYKELSDKWDATSRALDRLFKGFA